VTRSAASQGHGIGRSSGTPSLDPQADGLHCLKLLIIQPPPIAPDLRRDE
jgi:hypothetical protein